MEVFFFGKVSGMVTFDYRVFFFDRYVHPEQQRLFFLLVYPVTGKMFAAVVDIREDSDTFGKYETFRSRIRLFDLHLFYFG